MMRFRTAVDRVRMFFSRGIVFPAAMASVLVSLLLPVSGPAHAGGRILLEKNFKEVSASGGTVSAKQDGLRVRTERLEGGVERGVDKADFPFVAGREIAPEKGTLLFRVRRAPDPVKKQRNDYDALFAIADPKGRHIMVAYILWDVPDRYAGKHRAGLNIYSDSIMPRSVWGFWVPFARDIRPGESFTLSFSWGTGKNTIYLDGAPLADVFGDFLGREVVDPVDPFGPSLANAELIRFGADLFSGDNSPLDSAYLEGMSVLDEPSSGAGWVQAAIASVADDSFKVAGISGKLVAGDTVSVELKASPGGSASFDMGNVKGIPMAEVPPTEGGPGTPAVDYGTYRGAYTIKPGDDFADGYILGHFTSPDNVAAEPVASSSKWAIDTKPVVTFAIDKKDLPADSTAKARIKLVAKDANGNAVKGRHFKLTLATTDEYTGTVGAGDFGEQVGASVETRWRGETDSWGEVEFDYKAGFAAKTVILSAKDLDSGGTSVDFVTSYKEAAIDIALTPVVSRAAARRGLQYIVKVEASRTELTADGRSRSVIRATVMDPNGAAVANDPVTFALSSENGTLRTIKAATDSSGKATAEYVAGKKIGIVVVTATAMLRNASGSVSITLLSDAPAKIYLKARPEALPADGFSRADLSVKVTDVNDNPNRDTKVEFRVAKGGGKLEYVDRTTDRFGDAGNRYTAGTTPGVASIVATVRSKVPADVELDRAKNVLFAPYSPDGDEIRVEKWLKRKGESFVKGEALVEYTVGRSRDAKFVVAPYDGTMGEQLVEYWDTAEVGQTLGLLVPAAL